MRARWALANYYEQLCRIVAGFEPEVPLEDMPLQERERLARVVRKVDARDAAEIANRVEALWQSARSQFPVSAGESLLARLRAKVLLPSYYGIVEDVLSERAAADSRAAFVFVPLRPPSAQGGEKSQAHAAELASRVTASDVPHIDQAVDKEWSEALARLPDCLRDAVDPELREAFLQDRYYPIMEEVLARRAR